MLLLRLALVAVNAFYSSSSLVAENEGIEEVSDVVEWLDNFAPQRSFLRRANHTGLNTAHDLHEALDEDFDQAWGEDFENAWDEEMNDDALYSYLDEDFDVEVEELKRRSNVTAYNRDAVSGGRLLVQMTERDKQWLSSHNIRRKRYHSKYNKKYVPLKWSLTLKQLSKVWAKHLASLCGKKGIYHDPGNEYGENLASNWGTGTWSEQPSTDNVLRRFVEREENVGYPKNGHYTQVLWRSTKHVGCAEHTKVFRDGSGQKCHVQVCRYARPGNCNMRKYNNYKVPMLADSSPCAPFCPPGGCI
eukprot:CCRYP_006148-RA/>CCRYP_006148-RA protein AED:0.07 eAED:0.07 QI:1254/1/1/1/0.8/0.66/6/271/302